MSDLCIYELEDNIWNEFDEGGDHIVPHSLDGERDQTVVQSDSRKVIGLTSNVDNAARYVTQRTEESSLLNLTRKDSMLEKGSWSQTPDGVLSASCNGNTAKEVTNLTSNDTKPSSGDFKSGINSGSDFCSDDAILGAGCAAVANSLYEYPISQTDSDLNFFDIHHDKKESSDLLDYGWPDIGNFDDVDRMFRSCDSTFGLGSITNEDELCWFSSSHANEGSDGDMKPAFNFPSSGSHGLESASGNQEASRPSNGGPSIEESNMSSAAMFGNTGPQTTETEINMQKMKPKQENQSEGKDSRYLENGGSFNRYQGLEHFADLKHPLANLSSTIFPSPGVQQPNLNVQPHSLGYMPTDLSHMHLNFSHPTDQISVLPALSSCQSSSHPSPSTKGSSYASNELLSQDNGKAPSFNSVAMSKNEKRKVHHHQDLKAPLSRNFKHVDMESPVTFYDQGHNQKQACQLKNEIEAHSSVEGVGTEIPVELDSTNAQESSFMGSTSDEISIEASSFRQLQQVMEKLDIRTKLCIRDSLYRLARSAEKRHGSANLDDTIRHDRGVNGALMAEETKKCAELMDMETNTNPIDRSIAHLLFHRPSDPSLMPGDNALSFKSPTMIHASATSQAMIARKQVYQERALNSGDKKFGDEK